MLAHFFGRRNEQSQTLTLHIHVRNQDRKKCKTSAYSNKLYTSQYTLLGIDSKRDRLVSGFCSVAEFRFPLISFVSLNVINNAFHLCGWFRYCVSIYTWKAGSFVSRLNLLTRKPGPDMRINIFKLIYCLMLNISKFVIARTFNCVEI